MSPQTLFYIIILILILSFILDTVLDVLNAKHFNNSIPNELKDVYDKDAYKKSQNYKISNFKFELISATFSLVLTLSFFFFNGFALVDTWVRGITDNNILMSILFFGVIIIGSDLITTPFAYYKTFVIEEKFGFNKTTKSTFLIDKLKGLVITIIIGGCVLAVITAFYYKFPDLFWVYTWGLITLFTLFMNLFYSKLIVPIFNKQEPLQHGSLKTAISNYAKTVGFKLDTIFVINGSKRSTKANAFFSGFGAQKRITLYDTLINDLEEDEIVAVLAHEVGHYKHKHIIFNLFASVLLTGITLYVLSLFVSNPIFAEALAITTPSFHVGLIVFGVLYSPISEITGLIMNVFSRKFEYEADNYAKETFKAQPLITALKKLSKNSLSNLTPHKAYVFMHYSHPTLLQRIKNLNASN